jgi:hypothetical protein
MIRLQNVSYVRLGTRDLDGAATFASDYLGLEIAYASRCATSPVRRPIRPSRLKSRNARTWTRQGPSSKASGMRCASGPGKRPSCAA